MTNKHGLTRFIHAPTEGKHLSAMLISIIPSMPRGYTKILLPTPIVTPLKIVEPTRNRVKGCIIVTGWEVIWNWIIPFLFCNVGYVWKTFELENSSTSCSLTYLILLKINGSLSEFRLMHNVNGSNDRCNYPDWNNRCFIISSQKLP
jgi:hypothetical protein